MVSAAGVVRGDFEPQVNIDERLPVQVGYGTRKTEITARPELAP
jgi:hypothetical protein